MRYFELCEKSEKFANDIMESNDFKELLLLKDRISKEIPELLEEFNKAKIKYDEVMEYGVYHPDYKASKLRLVKAKEVLYTNELVKRYKELERSIQEKLDLASKEIVKAISNNIK
jgi:cell fate (sporulation/competence/biofilm development) regulator YlbF (YheA/YmcA/DUF963 family)